MRTMRILTRLGALIEEPDRTYLAETETDGALRSLQAASCTYRIALGPRAGQKVLSLQSLPSAARPSAPELRVNAQGFSLHAAVRWRADQRAELEELRRYITRPAIANERLKRNRAGQVVLQLKSPYKDGTTHIVMEPLEFMERLAALVPRPRLHLIRFHGVLAPNAKRLDKDGNVVKLVMLDPATVRHAIDKILPDEQIANPPAVNIRFIQFSRPAQLPAKDVSITVPRSNYDSLPAAEEKTELKPPQMRFHSFASGNGKRRQ